MFDVVCDHCDAELACIFCHSDGEWGGGRVGVGRGWVGTGQAGRRDDGDVDGRRREGAAVPLTAAVSLFWCGPSAPCPGAPPGEACVPAGPTTTPSGGRARRDLAAKGAATTSNLTLPASPPVGPRLAFCRRVPVRGLRRLCPPSEQGTHGLSLLQGGQGPRGAAVRPLLGGGPFSRLGDGNGLALRRGEGRALGKRAFCANFHTLGPL